MALGVAGRDKDRCRVLVAVAARAALKILPAR